MAPLGTLWHGNGRVMNQPLLRTLGEWFSKTFNYREYQLGHTNISSVRVSPCAVTGIMSIPLLDFGEDCKADSGLWV